MTAGIAIGYNTRLCYEGIMSNYVGHARQFILYTVGFIRIRPICMHVYTVFSNSVFRRCVVDDHMSLANLRRIPLLLVHRPT